MTSIIKRVKAFMNPDGVAKQPLPSTPLERYYALCEQRDAKYKEVEGLKAKLVAANEQVVAAQNAANELAAQLSDSLGGQDWIKLKKEIADLARQLGKIPHRT